VTSELLTYALALLAVAGALGVLLTRAIIHMALFMMLAIFSTCAIILLQNIELISAIVMWLFGGACLVLLLSASLLIHLRQTEKSPRKIVVSKVLFVLIATYIGIQSIVLFPALKLPPLSAAMLQTHVMADHFHQDYGFLAFLTLVTLFIGLAASVLMIRKE